jgi:FdhE protein
VLIHALHPFLQGFATVLAPLIEDERWYQRRCPVCHGEPDFGYLEEKVGGLRLLCSRCDVVWTYERGECTFCGNSDTDTFAYYLSDDDVYRLYVCDDCDRYLKVLDGRQTSLKSLLPIQRIMTVGMDISARQQGYR